MCVSDIVNYLYSLFFAEKPVGKREFIKVEYEIYLHYHKYRVSY